MSLEDTSLWEELLPAISRREVLPVIGPDLLWMEMAGEEHLLESWLAASLSRSLGVLATAGADLEQVTIGYLEKSRSHQPSQMHSKLESELRRLCSADGSPPQFPLLKALSNLPFPLWLTTTTDDWTRECLGVAEPDAGYYSPSYYRDLKPAPHEGTTQIFHLFGRLSNGVGRAAILEVDVLEYLWCLHGDLREKLPVLAERLATSRLLLLGTAHPDWLARFFLRLIRRDGFDSQGSLVKGRREFIADRVASGDKRLGKFIEMFNVQGGIFNVLEARHFIPELVRRWGEYEQKNPMPARTEASRPAASAGGSGGGHAAFISYASEDRAAAIRTRERLDGAGLSCWLDKDRQDNDLAGADWWMVIEKQIRACDVFIALVSRTTLNRDEGIFMKEWKTAVSKNMEVNHAERKYIWLVVVDDTRPEAVNYPDRGSLNVNMASGGQLSDTLLDELKKEVRKRRGRQIPGGLHP